MQASVILGFCLALLQIGIVQNENPSNPETPTQTSQVTSISNNLTVTLADPMTPPNATGFIGYTKFCIYNLTVHGLSNYIVEADTMFLDKMQVYVLIRMKKISVDGIFKMNPYTTKNGSFSTMFKPMIEPFNITFKNVTAECTVGLKGDPTGKLYAEKSSTDMSYENLEVFTEAKPGSIEHGALEGIGMNLFPLMKPHILGQIDKQLIENINKRLESSPKFSTIKR